MRALRNSAPVPRVGWTGERYGGRGICGRCQVEVSESRPKSAGYRGIPAAGASQLSPLYFEVIRNYGGGRGAAFFHVVLPGSLPFILNGIRVAMNLGLLVTIAMEFTVVSPGIGSIIWLSLQTMRIEELYAGIAIISLIGITLNVPVQWLLRRTAAWQ